MAIEERVSNLETEFRTELRHLATKEDLANLKSDLLRWVVGFQLLGIAAVAAIVQLVSYALWTFSPAPAS